MNPKVNFYFEKVNRWQQEIEELRKLLAYFSLTEELKWGCPCYTLNGSNVILIHVFKEYCALLFFKGALLNDTHGILIRQTENVQSARQIRFTGLHEITEQDAIIKALISEAIEVEKAGLTVQRKKIEEFKIPGEFQSKLHAIPGLKTAFDGLTPGRQRAYLYHFSQPKQSKTREARVEKYTPKILAGKGWDD